MIDIQFLIFFIHLLKKKFYECYWKFTVKTCNIFEFICWNKRKSFQLKEYKSIIHIFTIYLLFGLFST